MKRKRGQPRQEKDGNFVNVFDENESTDGSSVLTFWGNGLAKLIGLLWELCFETIFFAPTFGASEEEVRREVSSFFQTRSRVTDALAELVLLLVRNCEAKSHECS